MTFELFGTARLRARVARVEIAAEDLGRAIAGLREACPSLDGQVISRGAVLPSYRLSLNGDRFVTDPTTPLRDEDCLLLISADAGG